MNQALKPPSDSQASADTSGAPAPSPSLDAFEAAYDRWKAATVVFEQAVRRMHGGDAAAREQAQHCARELAHLHHAFLEASQPHFAADAGQADSEPRPNPNTSPSAGAPMAPGDEAPVGTPGTGEALCHECGGSGRIGSTACPACLGTGTINAGIGGA